MTVKPPELSEAELDEIVEYLCGPDYEEKAALQALSNSRLLRLLLENDRRIDDDVVAHAIQRKDKECIRTLLHFGWDTNHPLWDNPPLFAIDDEDFTRWLLENGADVNVRPRLDQPVLTNAIVVSDIKVVRLLLAQGADASHGTLLHSAVSRENQQEGAELVEDLAQRGADVNELRHTNPVAFRQQALFYLPTPLCLACDKENIPAARALLRNGADPNRRPLFRGYYAANAVERARSGNNPELLSLIQAARSKT
ncbi:ankyrin [Teratosphaeria nubilosa]|uniref:Ankyrin n=1 Tax=Teratosphaeria nubilosa TaxID=161662 RepID=A0A6G1LAD3_9PEZI|nr:ankyrin [Teratosphaeria nubilosa]